MSQLDKVHFIPVLSWIVILFVIWYGIVVSNLIPKYYKVMRSRAIYESYLYQEIKKSEYLINICKIYYNNWMNEIIKLMKIKIVIKYAKINIEGVRKLNYTEIIEEDINNIGYVFKVSDDIAYARGLLKVQMSEFELKIMKFHVSRPVLGRERWFYNLFWNIPSKMKNNLWNIKNKKYSTLLEVTDKELYINKMKSYFKLEYKRIYGKKTEINEELLDNLEYFLKQEQRHVQSIEFIKINKKEVLVVAYFHTAQSKDVKLVSQEIMKIKQLGNNSYTGFYGVNEKPVVTNMKIKDIKKIYKDVTDETLNKLKMDRQTKEIETEQLFENIEGKDVEVFNRIGRKYKQKIEEDMSELKNLEDRVEEIKNMKPPFFD